MSKVVRIESVVIGIFDPYLDTLGGGEKYMLTAASCLSKEQAVFIFWDDQDVLVKAQERFGIDLRSVKTTKNIFSKKISFLSRLIESRKFDAIIYLSDGSIPFVLSKKLFLHFQFPVVWIHGRSAKNEWKLKLVQAIICNSQFTKKHIDKTFESKSLVVYPPASGEFMEKKIAKENLILSVGRFSLLSDHTTFKKQEVMITMFQEMVDKGLKDWKLVLVVSFSPHDEVKTALLYEKIRNYPIEIRVNVSAGLLFTLYAKSRVYWHAAGFGEDVRLHPERTEHFGIATVQAMEQGAVPVVIDAGGQPEIVQEGENGFLWKTTEECITKTWKLIENRKLQEKLSIHAKERAKDFSKELFCKKICSIVKD